MYENMMLPLWLVPGDLCVPPPVAGHTRRLPRPGDEEPRRGGLQAGAGLGGQGPGLHIVLRSLGHLAPVLAGPPGHVRGGAAPGSALQVLGREDTAIS